MAINNRTEAQSQTTALIVPQVTNSIHINLLNNNILNSILFRKDVKVAQNESGNASGILDYTNADMITLAINQNFDIAAVNGTVDGDVKYLEVTKTLSDSLTFSGAAYSSMFAACIDNRSTLATFVLENKNGVVYVNSIWNNSDDSWKTITPINGWVLNYGKYRVDKFGYMEVIASFGSASATNDFAFQVNASDIPNYFVGKPIVNFASAHTVAVGFTLSAARDFAILGRTDTTVFYINTRFLLYKS